MTPLSEKLAKLLGYRRVTDEAIVAKVAALEAQVAALKDYITNIRPVLAAAEWENSFCPTCCAPKEQGHSVSCWMAYAIAEAERLVKGTS